MLAVKVIPIETAQSVYDLTNNWNIPTNLWLKRYVYTRVREGRKPTDRNVLAVSVVSATWHGFYPGYYMFFLTLSLSVFAGRSTRSSQLPTQLL